LYKQLGQIKDLDVQFQKERRNHDSELLVSDFVLIIINYLNQLEGGRMILFAVVNM